MQDPQPEESPWKTLGRFGVIISDLVGFTGAGIGIGYLASKKWGAPPWVIMITALGGLVVAFYRIYLLFNQDGQKS